MTTQQHDGGPATVSERTMRDEIAIALLPTIYAEERYNRNTMGWNSWPNAAARRAYAVADAMLAARKEPV